VAVYDHHVDNTPNIQHDELVIEPVGSATTVLVEKLRALFDAVGGAAGGGVGGAAGGEGAGCGEGGQGQEGAPLPLSEAEATPDWCSRGSPRPETLPRHFRDPSRRRSSRSVSALTRARCRTRTRRRATGTRWCG